jgi:hypothetical protein
MLFFNPKKFQSEISALRKLKSEAELSPLRKESLRVGLLLRIQQEAQSPARQHEILPRGGIFFHFRYALASLAGIFLVFGAVSAASGNAVPGDVLFPIKKATESVQLALTPSKDSRAKLQADFAEKRLNELNQIESAPQVNTTAQSQAQSEVAQAVHTLVETRDHLPESKDAPAKAAVVKTIDKLVTRFESEGQDGKIMGVIQKSGDAFQIVGVGKTLTLVSRDDLDSFAGQQVLVTGKISGDTMVVNELKSIPTSGHENQGGDSQKNSGKNRDWFQQNSRQWGRPSSTPPYWQNLTPRNTSSVIQENPTNNGKNTEQNGEVHGQQIKNQETQNFQKDSNPGQKHEDRRDESER